ncbi:MAG TPA: GNAT family N-acetyltransferase [Vitreimonas sp.]|uniref:GNAT family N-acetyltransferase n=1 Tax=Vitreimonas sp. TaxID=3069702 RepID=UPI002D363D28|nr:GNAT family N-acetyltransferase [Vitreimonas sp.]HYD86345.1 GNAT family N-acetyltransferase [Vitreimonas sp.]
MKTPRLEAPGVVLRPLARADAPALFLAMSDAEAQRYRRQSPHQTVMETASYIDDTLARGFGWAITVDGEEALGRIALRVDGATGQIGIILRGSAQGRGLGAASLRLVQAFAFEALRLEKLTADIDSENMKSLRLFARAGFTQTGFMRAGAITHAGVRDSVIVAKAAAQ